MRAEKSDVGLGKKKLRKSFTPKFRTYRDGKKEWLGNLIDFRNALAHRIPLFIPLIPRSLVKKYAFVH